MTDFCICRAIVSLLSPTSSLRAFLTSLEYPPSTSTITLNCITRYSGNLSSSFQRNGPYFVVFSASFSSLFSTQGQLPVFNPMAAYYYYYYYCYYYYYYIFFLCRLPFLYLFKWLQNFGKSEHQIFLNIVIEGNLTSQTT